jgi:ribosomal protein S18 acetylase RimI-like enzyme
VDSRLFLVAEIEGSPIAYIWSTPDYNQIFLKMNGRLGPFQIFQFLCKKQQINTGKLHLIGIKKEFRNRNIGSLLNYKILIEMKNRGYIGAEVGWIDEENATAHTTIAITGATLYKKHRVFEKDLTI